MKTKSSWHLAQHLPRQARILKSFIADIFEKIAVETASLASYNNKPTLLQHFASSYITFVSAGAQKRGLKHHQTRTTRRLMISMARIPTVSRKVKTVEAEMTTESTVFTAAHMLACALDAQCFAMPSLSPFNPYLMISCCICTIRAVVRCSLHLPCCFCLWTMASSRPVCMARSLYGLHAVLFAVESNIQLTSNCCFSKVLGNSIA